MVCVLAVRLAGSITVNGTHLDTRDGAQIVGSATGTTALELVAQGKGAHFLIVEMAKEQQFRPSEF